MFFGTQLVSGRQVHSQTHPSVRGVMKPAESINMYSTTWASGLVTARSHFHFSIVRVLH
jgi:hypothetical protein